MCTAKDIGDIIHISQIFPVFQMLVFECTSHVQNPCEFGVFVHPFTFPLFTFRVPSRTCGMNILHYST